MFFEPAAKSTFAPIAVLTQKIYERDKKAVILVFPCDHYIKNKERFQRILKKAVEASSKGYIGTLGVKPKRPETGYGYIKVSSWFMVHGSWVYKVARFEEKPSVEKAGKFFRDRRYYWNSGIFIFRAKDMLEEIKRLMPEDYALLSKINNRGLNKYWPKLATLSVDYAIMEKTNKLVLVPEDFGWLDVGDWNAMSFLSKKDRNGNILNGNCIDIGSRNIFSSSDGRLVATVGLNNMIVVATDEAVLVCSKAKAQEVRKVAQLLK